MKKSVLKEYARLIARKGVNVQKGQEVVINAQLDQPEFVKILVEECYKAGAGKVEVQWAYQPLTALHVKHQKEKILSKVEEWEIARLRHRADVLPAMIHLESADPDGLAGIDQAKFSKATQAIRKVSKPFRDEMENKYQWCIAAVPGKAWAKKLFPKERASVAEEKLWEAILYTSRATGDPIGNWEKHNEELAKRCERLNSLGLRELHYRSSNGTDFKVGLLANVNFLAGSEKTLAGVEYNPNIPSEEVFTSPDKNKAEGVVVSTKPLSYRGELIENFRIEFKDGKAVKVSAEKNEELLRDLISMDETACRLGECALVPYDSPISNSGLLFYNTLFDENASCHLAFGFGFTGCVEGFEEMSAEECFAKGINDSIIHVDFMIGSSDLDIDGITENGETVAIFKNGNWAF